MLCSHRVHLLSRHPCHLSRRPCHRHRLLCSHRVHLLSRCPCHLSHHLCHRPLLRFHHRHFHRRSFDHPQSLLEVNLVVPCSAALALGQIVLCRFSTDIFRFGIARSRLKSYRSPGSVVGCLFLWICQTLNRVCLIDLTDSPARTYRFEIDSTAACLIATDRIVICLIAICLTVVAHSDSTSVCHWTVWAAAIPFGARRAVLLFQNVSPL